MKNTNRRNFLKITTAVGTASLAAPLFADKAKQPNILLIVTDQESKLPDEIYSKLEIPNRKWIDQRGTSFDNFFCVTPQCSPARSTLQTGLYPHQTRHVSNTNKSFCNTIPEGTEFLGKQLMAAGYQNGYSGKWHLKDGKGRLGVGKVTGGMNDAKQGAYFRKFMTTKDKNKPWFYQAHYLNPHDIYHFSIIFEGEEPKKDHPKYDKQKKRALQFMKKHPNLPLPPGWDAEIAGIPPAKGDWAYPYGNSGKYERLSKKKKEQYWQKYRALYYSLYELVDEQIGEFLDVLRKEHADELENTIIIFTSDHGDLGGNHESLKYKGPLPFDPQLHIPCVVAGPGIGINKRVKELASQADLAATICDMAGAAAPNQGRSDARSLLPVLKGTGTPGRDFIVSEYYVLGGVQPLRILRTPTHKYAIHYAEKAKVLFDLKKDPFERVNLHGDAAYADIEQSLHDKLLELQKRHNDPVNEENHLINDWRNPNKKKKKKKKKK